MSCIQNTLRGIAFGCILTTSSVWAQDCDPVEISNFLADDWEIGDFFGDAMSAIGPAGSESVLVGVPKDDDNGQGSGSAYIFTRDGMQWVQQDKLRPADGASGDRFGAAVSFDGETIVIGAPGDDDQGSSSGSVYVFILLDGDWVQYQKLTPSDGATFDFFGAAVSLDGDTLVVGARGDDDHGSGSGSAYVFARNSNNMWEQQYKLVPKDGEQWDSFGYSVSLDNDTVVIGAWLDDDQGIDSGAAYVFVRSGDEWEQQAKLLGDPYQEYAGMGYSVSLSGDTVIVGGNATEEHSAGPAYIFAKNSDQLWVRQATLNYSNYINYFGYSVSLDGDTAVAVGTWIQNIESGVYFHIFKRTGNNWVDSTGGVRIPLPDGEPTISLSGGVLFAGITDIYPDDLDGVYVYDVTCDGCSTDLNQDGNTNIQDFLLFLEAWAAGDPLADWNGDGVVNTMDFSDFLNKWVAGCP